MKTHNFHSSLKFVFRNICVCKTQSILGLEYLIAKHGKYMAVKIRASSQCLDMIYNIYQIRRWLVNSEIQHPKDQTVTFDKFCSPFYVHVGHIVPYIYMYISTSIALKSLDLRVLNVCGFSKTVRTHQIYEALFLFKYSVYNVLEIHN